MDRRRFTPSPEGLEGRAVMSGLFGGTAQNYNSQLDLQNLPETYRQKELRIAHLPFFLQQEQAQRFLPTSTLNALQNDITAVVSSLNSPSAQVVDAFNVGLRNSEPYATLSPAQARQLNHEFGNVLKSAGATPQEQANLQNDMNTLALIDSRSIDASQLAREDYAVVLQTTMAVGRPIQTPYAPDLQRTDGIRISNGIGGYTRDHTPTFVGTYLAGATRIGELRIQLVDATNGAILGTGVINTAGSYETKITTPLPDGTYYVRSRAIDEVGHASHLSPRAFTLKIVSKVPQSVIK